MDLMTITALGLISSTVSMTFSIKVCKARFEKNPLRILDCKVDAKHPAMKTAPKTIDYLSESAKNHFDKVSHSFLDVHLHF